MVALVWLRERCSIPFKKMNDGFETRYLCCFQRGISELSIAGSGRVAVRRDGEWNGKSHERLGHFLISNDLGSDIKSE